METIETRKKLADGIRTLQVSGDTDSINRLVSAYKSKYQTSESAEKEPSFLGGIARDVSRPFARLSQNIRATGEIATGTPYEEAIKPVQSKYWGELKPVGQEGTFGQRVGESFGVGAQIASNLPFTGGVTGIAKAGLKGLIKQGLKTGVREGVAGGALYGGGKAAEEGKGIGEIAKETALGGALGGLGGGILGGSVPVVGKLLKGAKTAILNPVDYIESKILSKYEKGVKPLLPGKTTPSQLKNYRSKVIDAGLTINENKANLNFSDDVGDEVVGQNPKSLQQLADSVEQTKKRVFSEYDTLAKQAGEAGVTVDMAPIASELDSVINNKALAITSPKTIQYAQQAQERLLTAGKLDTVTAQEVVQNYNKSLEAFYRNPSYDNASQAAVDAMLANNMRKALDEGITGLTGTQYQALKNKYASLKAIEKDVIKAALRDARKNVKGLIDFTDIFSGGQVVNGILTMNPAAIAQGFTQKGIASLYKFMTDPNRAIAKMFQSIEKNAQRLRQSRNSGNILLQTQANNINPTKPIINAISPIIASNGKKSIPIISKSKNFNSPVLGKIEKFEGDENFGMIKIEKRHPDVLPYLDEAMQKAKIIEKYPDMSILEANVGKQKIRLIVDHQLGTKDGTVPKLFLNNAYFVPREGLEPTTFRASGERSTTELSRPIDSIPKPQRKSTASQVDNLQKKSITNTLKKKGEQQAFGAVAGIEEDKEKGGIKFDPKKAAIGIGAIGAVSSKSGKKIGEQVFKGFKDLSTKLVEKLKGRSEVSKQFISDLTNSPDLKQVEKDVIRNILETEKGVVNVPEFAKKVQAELVPLKVKSSDVINAKAKDHYSSNYMRSEGDFSSKYENIALPKEIRGNVADYKENIYESPITTSAGDVHFNYNTRNYFGHTRIEDMADNKTRRVIEVQSDLYQKGNLEREKNLWAEMGPNESKNSMELKYGHKGFADKMAKRRTDVAKLQQYNDPTAHFRMVREEIKKAAQDGKTKLQFPTGEIAMKIEGLGENYDFKWHNGSKMEASDLTKDTIGGYFNNNGENWIITDILGDGKFKAMPKEHFDSFVESKGLTISGEDLISYAEHHATKNFWGSKESFDISGKVDTNNPIYKFYEKDLGKYVTNKYGARRITDDKGVSWYEVPIKKDYTKLPIEAFAFAPLTFLPKRKDEKKKSLPFNFIKK